MQHFPSPFLKKAPALKSNNFIMRTFHQDRYSSRSRHVPLPSRPRIRDHRDPQAQRSTASKTPLPWSRSSTASMHISLPESYRGADESGQRSGKQHLPRTRMLATGGVAQIWKSRTFSCRRRGLEAEMRSAELERWKLEGTKRVVEMRNAVGSHERGRTGYCQGVGDCEGCSSSKRCDK